MEKSARIIFMMYLLAGTLPAIAQGIAVPPPAGGLREGHHMRMREMTPEQREQWREERRQMREAWQQMSPEERQQLRRDIRDSGQALYPRGPQQFRERGTP